MNRALPVFLFLKGIEINGVQGVHWGFPGGSDGKESACSTGDLAFITCRKEWQLTPVFLSGEFHGQAIVHGVAKTRTRLSD